ncbi:MAG: hypothetical protein ISS70_08115 [Phycisphaerae bacterium]|nr:hypothetical protein [Phycisphaerae bacterium]
MADVLAPGSFHVEQGNVDLIGEILQAFAVNAVMIRFANGLPLVLVTRVEASKGAGHQENICIGAGSDLTDDAPDGIYIAAMAYAPDYDQVRFVIEDISLYTAGLLVPPTAG